MDNNRDAFTDTIDEIILLVLALCTLGFTTLILAKRDTSKSLIHSLFMRISCYEELDASSLI